MVRNTQRRNLSKKIKKSYRNKKRNKSKKRLRRGGAEVPELPVEQMMVNAREMQTLEEENERLKAENERLKEENKGLKEENERLNAENKKQSSVVKLLSLPDIKVKGIEGVTFSSNDFTANLQNNHDTKSGINKYSNQGSDKYKLSQSYKKSTAREKYLKDLLNDFIKSNNIKIKKDDSTFTNFIILMHYFMGLSMKNKDNQYIDINKTLFNEKNKTKRENEKKESILHMMHKVLLKNITILESIKILVNRGYISILVSRESDDYKDKNIKNIKTFYESYLNLDDAVKDESTN